MDSSMIKGVVIGGIAMVVVSAGAVTGYKALTKPKFAEVVAVKEVTETIVTPREECHDVQVQKQAPREGQPAHRRDSDRRSCGRPLGNSIGGGTGRTVATVAGAAGGAYVGNQVQKNMQEKNVVTTTAAALQDRSTTRRRICSATTSPIALKARRASCALPSSPAPRCR